VLLFGGRTILGVAGGDDTHVETVELLRASAIEAEVIAARLRSEGIPAVVFGGGGYGGGPAVGEGDGVRVMVRRSDLELATALTAEAPPD
jgi:hypothetical protein